MLRSGRSPKLISKSNTEIGWEGSHEALNLYGHEGVFSARKLKMSDYKVLYILHIVQCTFFQIAIYFFL